MGTNEHVTVRHLYALGFLPCVVLPNELCVPSPSATASSDYSATAQPSAGPSSATTPAADGSTEAQSASGILVRYKAVCTNCGWQGSVGLQSDAESDKGNHIDDHPKCDGKVELRKVSWYDGKPVE